ncbi:hypothetical protein CASFOL_020893 [Castilleja foliolosa]|uniref:Uncharacterized protein n=1 Tax=Castilleja foliolosa TaxID=1961234 RepID=A0ABD3D4A1_9LAMI
MQASNQEKLNPAVHEFYSETEITRDFYSHLKLDDDNLQGHHDHEMRLDDEEEEEEKGEDDFSFNCGELNSSPIAAEDAFVNGQIKPLINRDLFFSGEEKKPPVKNIFLETNRDDEMTSSGSGGDEILGPYCEWSSRPKAVEACKKSNSTGFSKIWRVRERVGRSSSDGKDAFVFLNAGGRREEEAAEEEKGVKAVKGKKNSKTVTLSAHEVYLKSKGQGDERRRSYLPYRPELMGFFTNVNGGLTKNVHPF